MCLRRGECRVTGDPEQQFVISGSLGGSALAVTDLNLRPPGALAWMSVAPGRALDLRSTE